jgi:hypothetical protein
MAYINNPAVETKKCAIELARMSCLACVNYRSTHQITKASYCANGDKTVYVNSGCDQWRAHPAVAAAVVNQQPAGQE